MTNADELRRIANKVATVYPDEGKRLRLIAVTVDRMTECLDAIVQESIDTSRSRYEAIREMDQ